MLPEYLSPKHKLRVNLSEELIKDLKGVMGLDLEKEIENILKSVDDSADSKLAAKEGEK